MTQVFNFSAGPAMLPVEVMQQAQQELINFQGHGCSVMELSHRSKAFINIAETAEADLRELLSIPDNYKVLFLQGGGRGHFASIPLNISREEQVANMVVSGSWSKSAVDEANKYLNTHVVDVVSTNQQGHKQVMPFEQWNLAKQAAYLHFCPNETVDGISIDLLPETDAPIVADLSSCILSKPIDVSRYGVIYAGAQKNIGPSGLSIVIVREDLLGQARKETPSIFDYTIQAEKGSMFNTPPTFAWYLAGLVFKWLKAQGGVNAMESVNQQKAELLYSFIDQSDFYLSKVATANRSKMNVPFYLADENLNQAFLQQAENAGLLALKGHRSVGGMRASIYNAMPIEGVQALVAFMQTFELQNKG